jgi:hypothetical protein
LLYLSLIRDTGPAMLDFRLSDLGFHAQWCDPLNWLIDPVGSADYKFVPLNFG